MAHSRMKSKGKKEIIGNSKKTVIHIVIVLFFYF